MNKQLSPDLLEKITFFFEYHPAHQLNQNLRRVLLDYLRIELRSGIPLFTEELLSSLYDLFDLLDEVSEQTKDWQKKKEKDTT